MILHRNQRVEFFLKIRGIKKKKKITRSRPWGSSWARIQSGGNGGSCCGPAAVGGLDMTRGLEVAAVGPDMPVVVSDMAESPRMVMVGPDETGGLEAATASGTKGP